MAVTDRVKEILAHDSSEIPGTRTQIARLLTRGRLGGTGGEAKGSDEILAEVRGIAEGGGFGSIMGRNAFQRPRAEARKLLGDVMEVYRKAS